MLSRAIGARKAQGSTRAFRPGAQHHPDFAIWLAEQGIASISLNPDSVIDTWQQLASPLANPEHHRGRRVR